MQGDRQGSVVVVAASAQLMRHLCMLIWKAGRVCLLTSTSAHAQSEDLYTWRAQLPKIFSRIRFRPTRYDDLS